MNSLDEKITGALRDRADVYVDVESLLEGARQRGRHHLRLRRAAGAAIAAGTVAAVIAGTVITLNPTHGHRGTAAEPSHPTSAAPDGHPIPPPDGTPRPPAAGPGAIPAATDPRVIASDARLFHLDVDVTAAALPAPVIAFETNSQMGSESLTLQLGPTPSDTYPRIVATRDRDSLFQFGPLGQHSRAVKVSGKPATIWTTDAHPTETLIWQPLPGVWATVTYIGDDPTIRVAEAVRFNRVMRCAVPFTLATVAPGAWMDSCTVSADAAGVTANVEVRIQKGWGVLVKSLPRADAQPVHPTTRINGRPASTSREPIDGGSGFIDHIRIDYGARIVEFVGFIVQGPTLLQVAQGFRPIAGNDPNHWPSSPLT